MSRPPHGKYHDIAVCLSAIATLLLIWLAAQLTDIDTPTPDSAPDPLTSELADRHQDAAHTSRGSGRRPAPLPAAATPTPTPRGDDGEADPRGVGTTLDCIRWHESRDNYDAVNVSSGAAGAYQLMPAYSDNWARRYGYGEWAGVTADLWPRGVQDAVAARLFADWPQAWTTYGSCS